MTKEKEKEELICYLLGWKDEKTYKAHTKGVSKRPITHYLYTLSIVELEKIAKTTKKIANHTPNDYLNDETDTPDLYAEKTILISENLQLTLLEVDTFTEIFKRREAEYQDKLLAKLEKQKNEEKVKKSQTIQLDNYKVELESNVKQFQKLYRKSLTQTDSAKEKTLEKMFDIFDIRLVANTLSINSIETTISELGEEYCQFLPFYIEYKNEKLQTIINPIYTIGLYDSQNFIYLLECTKRDFNNYLQKNLSELSMLEFEDAFDEIWEYILNQWADQGRIDDETIQEIRAEVTDLKLFKGRFRPELHPKYIQKLYDYTKDECRKFLEIQTL